MIRKRLSYANVMATLALFVALGGGAYAALRVPPNSVGTKQLKQGAVTGGKVRRASLTGANVKPGSLTGEDIKKGSLSVAQFPQLGLANLLGASGTATNNTSIELAKGACGRFLFAASGVGPGDAVIVQGSDIVGLQHAIEGAPTIGNPNQITVSVCADSEHAVSQPPGTVQLRFDTLR